MPHRSRVNGSFAFSALHDSPTNRPIVDGEMWTEKFRQIVTQRIAQESQATANDGSHDIRYNLMAVVPDRRVAYLSKLNTLKANRHIVLEALECMMRPTRLPGTRLSTVVRSVSFHELIRAGPFDYHNYSKYPTALAYDEAPQPPNVIENVVQQGSTGALRESQSSALASESATPIDTPLTVDTTAGYQIQFTQTSTYTSANSLTSPLTIQTNNVSPAPSTSRYALAVSRLSPNHLAMCSAPRKLRPKLDRRLTVQTQPPTPPSSSTRTSVAIDFS